MKPVDKFGRPIYGRTWQRLVEVGDRLVKAGYDEHHAKPNLFVRRMEASRHRVNGSYYADLRGTDIVSIWEDPDSLFYAFFRPTPPSWLARRLWSEEIGRLVSGYGVPTRLSFYKTSEPGMQAAYGARRFSSSKIRMGCPFREVVPVQPPNQLAILVPTEYL